MDESHQPSKRKENIDQAKETRHKPEDLIQKMEGLPKILTFRERGFSMFKPHKLIVDGFMPNAFKNLFKIDRYRQIVSALTDEGLFYLSKKSSKDQKTSIKASHSRKTSIRLSVASSWSTMATRMPNC